MFLQFNVIDIHAPTIIVAYSSSCSSCFNFHCIVRVPLFCIFLSLLSSCRLFLARAESVETMDCLRRPRLDETVPRLNVPSRSSAILYDHLLTALLFFWFHASSTVDNYSYGAWLGPWF